MSEWEDGNWSGMKDLQLLVSLLRKLLSNSALSSLEFALVIGNEFREAKLATNAKRSQTPSECRSRKHHDKAGPASGPAFSSTPDVRTATGAAWRTSSCMRVCMYGWAQTRSECRSRERHIETGSGFP